MLRSNRELPAHLEQEHFQEFNLGDTNIEQQMSPRDLAALTANISSTEQELWYLNMYLDTLFNLGQSMAYVWITADR